MVSLWELTYYTTVLCALDIVKAIRGQTFMNICGITDMPHPYPAKPGY